MSTPFYLRMTKEEFSQIVRALMLAEHIFRRNEERKNGEPQTDAQKLKHPSEALSSLVEFFETRLSEEECDALFDEVLHELDAFVEAETWHELAWWIAERECARLGAECRDREARELVTDRIYHEVLEEFSRHGIERVRIPGLPRDALPPRRVAEALQHLRHQTRGLEKGAGRKRRRA